jgi:hypothetical protein
VRTVWGSELRAALPVATAKDTAEMLAVAGRPFCKGGAQRSGGWTDACPPAARTAGHGAVDMAISDSDNASGARLHPLPRPNPVWVLAAQHALRRGAPR